MTASDTISRRVAGLAVYDRHPPRPVPAGAGEVDDSVCVIFVHGSMDRGASFIKACRRLPEMCTVRYDRRGYGRSSDAGIATEIDHHVDDLVTLVDTVPSDSRVVLVGHSFGGVLALAAAQRRPYSVRAVGAFEAPMPWAPWWPTMSAGGDAVGVSRHGGTEDAAERFMRRMLGDERWERLPASTREDRRAEGAALVAELAAMRSVSVAPYDLDAIRQPVIAGYGTETSPHHVEAARRLAAEASSSELVVIEGAGHGAHASHPGPFAGLVERAVLGAGGLRATEPVVIEPARPSPSNGRFSA